MDSQQRKYFDYITHSVFPRLGISEAEEEDSDTFVVDGSKAHRVWFQLESGEDLVVEFYETSNAASRHIAHPVGEFDMPDFGAPADRCVTLIIVLGDDDKPVAEIGSDGYGNPQVTDGHLDDGEMKLIVSRVFAFMYQEIALGW